jgi:hypothetical protein
MMTQRYVMLPFYHKAQRLSIPSPLPNGRQGARVPRTTPSRLLHHLPGQEMIAGMGRGKLGGRERVGDGGAHYQLNMNDQHGKS